MVTIVVTVHVIVCVALGVIILLQQGKGAEIGAVFGGSSQTVFGASGAGNALTKATWTLAVAFFATSMFLALSSARRTTGSIFEGSPLAPVTASVPTPGEEGVHIGTPAGVMTPGAAPKALAPVKAANPAAPAKH